MNRFTILFSIVFLLQSSTFVNAAPKNPGYAQDTGDFLGSLFSNLGGYVRSVLHRAGNDFSRINKNVRIVASSAADKNLNAGFSANINKNFHKTPHVVYENHRVANNPATYYERDEFLPVESDSVGDFVGGFVATFEKNFGGRAPHFTYENRPVNVEKVVYEGQNKNVPAISSGAGGFANEFSATFEKTFGAKSPDVYYETAPVNIETQIYKEVNENIPLISNTDHEFNKKYTVSFDKNINVNTPKVIYDNPPIKDDAIPIIQQKEKNTENTFTKRTQGGFFASGSLGLRVDAPFTKVSLDVKKESENKGTNPHVEYIHDKEFIVDAIQPTDIINEVSSPFVDVNKNFVVAGAVEKSPVNVNVQKQIIASNFKEDTPLLLDVRKKVYIPETENQIKEVITVVDKGVPIPSLEINKSFSVSSGAHYSQGSPSADKKISEVYVKAPLTSVDVIKNIGSSSVNMEVPLNSVGVRKNIGGSLGVSVSAPFTQVDTTKVNGRKSVRVNAPFTSVHTEKDGLRKNVHVRAPFVDVQTDPSGVRVQAPFVDIQTGSHTFGGRKKLQIKVPFFNLSLR